jgi:transketolase
MNRAKGIEFSNGSLGMGLSLGIGVALAGTRRRSSYRVFVLMGDGECNEGSVWEAAMAAAHFQLDNLVAILDRNNFQQTGVNERIMSVGDLAAKWSSFGWTTLEVDGHDVGQLHDVLAERTAGKPTAVVARTIKGKGFSFSENNNDWHHKILTKSQHELAIAELERK